MAIKNEHSLGRRMRKGAVSYAMLAPFMIFFILFTVLPVLAAIGLGFTNFNMLETPDFVGLQNYQRLFVGDTVFITAIKNTFTHIWKYTSKHIVRLGKNNCYLLFWKW